MAVAFDAVGAGAAETGSDGAISWSHTATGSNRCVIVGISAGAAGLGSYTGLTRSVTYGGVTMTSLGAINSGGGTAGFVELFYLLNPTTGAQTVAVSTTVPNTLVGNSVSYTGVLSVGTGATSSTTGTPSVSVSSTAGDLAVAVFCSGSAISTPTQTQRYLNNWSTNNTAGNLLIQDAAGAGSVAFGAASNGDSWGCVAVNISAFAYVPSVTPAGNFFRFFGAHTVNVGDDPGSGPPPSGGGTAYVSQPSDFDTLFYTPSPPSYVPAENAYFTKYAAPSGPGFQFVCSDVNTTPWNSGMNAVLLKKNNTTAVGQTQDWTFDVYVPSQPAITGQGQGGVWWEMHTDLSSGHHLGINANNTWRFARQSALGQVYVRDFNNGPAVIHDTWLQWRWWVKWSFGGDGFLRIYINGVQYMNWSGPTQFSGDGEPKWQLGWYQWKSGQTATLRVANIQRAIS